MKGFLHTGFHHAGLLHVSGVVAPTGADQGRHHRPLRTTRWSHHHQDHLGSHCPDRHCHHSVHPTSQRCKSTLGGWPDHRRASPPFTVAGLVRTPTTEEERRGSSVVEPLTRGTSDLSITDRPTTPFHRADPPSPTPDLTNPNPNGLGSSSPPRLSPLGNNIICRVIWLPTSTLTNHRPPKRHHRCVSFRLDGAVSPVLPLGTERWGGGGVGKTVGRLTERQGRRR
jgi:hypothetical protein